MALTRPQYDLQFARLRKAIDALLAGGSRLHAVARGYYLVHLTASYLASSFGVVVVHKRDGRDDERDKFSHQATVSLVETLYDGMPRGNIQPGSARGIAAAKLTLREAARRVQLLQRDRVDADYGPTNIEEPYSETEAAERLNWARSVVEDLRSLL